MHLLVIEDERALCETIVRSLRRLAYLAVHFSHLHFPLLLLKLCMSPGTRLP